MKLPRLILSVAFLALAACVQAETYSSKESFSRTGTFSSTGTLTLENVNGDIEIRTWDKSEILIEGEKSAKTDDELKLIDLTIELTETKAAIKVRLPKRGGGFFSNGNIRAAVKFSITLPREASLNKINMVNADVTIDDVHGAMNVESVNGRIRANHLSNDARLSTVNGKIEAGVDTVSANQQFKFSTVNGTVSVTLPDDAGLKIHGEVVNGHIDSDFPLKLSGKFGPKNISGQIGDGRASLKAESVNGSINLKKR